MYSESPETLAALCAGNDQASVFNRYAHLVALEGSEHANWKANKGVAPFQRLRLVRARHAYGKGHTTATLPRFCWGKLYREGIQHCDHALIRSHCLKVDRCLLCDLFRGCNAIGRQSRATSVFTLGEGQHGKGLVVQSLGHIRLRCLWRVVRRWYAPIVQEPPNIASVEQRKKNFIIDSPTYTDPDLVLFPLGSFGITYEKAISSVNP